MKACNVPTDKSTATTYTSSCVTQTLYNDWEITDPDGLPPVLGAGGVLGYVDVMGTAGTFHSEYPSIISQVTPTKTTSPPTTTEPTYPPNPTWTPNYVYNCDGSTLCNTLNVKFCDKAVNNMMRGDHIYTANALLAISGNCWANSYGYGCKVVIQGEEALLNAPCTITGDEMWEAYQDIREFGGCTRCGNRYSGPLDASHGGKGCRVTIDYMSGCDNRDGGVNLLPGSEIATSATNRG